TDEMVMQDDDMKRGRLRVAQSLLGTPKLAPTDSSRLVSPRTDRVEADHVQGRGGVGRLGRLPLALELAERPGEASGKGIRDVVVSGDGEDGPPQGAQEPRGVDELVPTAAMAEIAAGNDEL